MPRKVLVIEDQHDIADLLKLHPARCVVGLVLGHPYRHFAGLSLESPARRLVLSVLDERLNRHVRYVV